MFERYRRSSRLSSAGGDPQDWPSDDFDPDSGEIQTEMLLSCDAVLMGRNTYDGFAPVWSARSGDPYSDRMNAMTKYAVSTTLKDPKWNNTTVIDSDLVAEIERIKKQPGGDIVQYGFGSVTYQLLTAGLIDEVRLWIHPFLLGTGGPDDRLFRPSELTRLDLRSTRELTNGIVILNYDVAG